MTSLFGIIDNPISIPPDPPLLMDRANWLKAIEKIRAMEQAGEISLADAPWRISAALRIKGIELTDQQAAEAAEAIR